MPGDADRDRPAPLAAVLAGGSGSRLGGAKARAELAGWPLISYPLAALAKAGIETLVVAKADFCLPAVFSGPDGDGSRPPRVLREPEHPRHPLCGIVAALREAGGRPLVVIACDMPLAEPALLAELAAAPEPLVVPAPGGRLQPLQARYSAGLLPSLEAALDREEPLRRTVESLSPRLLGDSELARFGDPEHLFFNVNDEVDLCRAGDILRR